MIRNIYIAEGFDRTGKTEISKEICEFFDTFYWQYYKNEREQERFSDGFDSKLAFKYETPIMMNVLKQFRADGVILDRFTPSEYVYAKALNRDFDEDLVWYYDKELAKMNAKILYFYKTEQQDYDDEYIDLSMKEKILNYYEEYFTKTQMKVFRIDTTSCDLKVEMKYILNHVIL